MTREDDFIGQLEGYLDEYEGITSLPEEIRDAVRAQLPRTRQIGPLAGPMRYLNMTTHVPNTVRYGLAAAAVVAAVIVGATLSGRGPNFGGGPEATPSPTASPVVTLTYSGTIQTLAAGTYTIPPGRFTPAKLTFAMPAGWDIQYLGFIKHRDESGELGWATDVVDHVYTDTCAADGTLQPIGSTVDDLVTALEQLGGATVSPAMETTVGGYPAKRVDIVLPDVDMATCRVPALQIWADAAEQDYFAQTPRDHASVYVIDVAGKVLAITTSQKPDSLPKDIAELSGIIGSIQIEPVAP
jgi:hypothetical protein